jgi:nicotinamide-nucleotide amidase
MAGLFQSYSYSSTSFCRIPLDVPGELFVSPMPYGRYDNQRVFKYFKQEEIQRAVVLLSDREIKKRCRRDLRKLYQKHHIEITQFPMVDFLQPGHGAMDKLIPHIATKLREGERIVVHCHAGVGRSSVVVACLTAVLQHMRIEECIEHVKSHMETNITVEQKRFIEGWVERLHESDPDAPLVLRSAELITTGSELLQGRILNRHGFTLGSLLTSFGLPLVRESIIPDDFQSIENAVLEAISRSDLVIVTGGLGPTDDDRTLEAVAQALDLKVVSNAEADRHLTDYFVSLRRTPTEQQKQQAKVLDGAEVYMNQVGIAPGQRLTLSNSRHLWLLPGPPRELDALIRTALRPWLAKAITRQDHHQRIFRIINHSESRVEDLVRQMPGHHDVEIAYCATPGSVELRFTGNEKDVDKLRGYVLSKFGSDLLNETGDPLEIEVGRFLTERKQTLAVAESCTGGGIGKRLTDVPGSSSFFAGGLITYSYEMKEKLLGVDPETLKEKGAVSPEVALQMAAGARKQCCTDWGLSVTGIAGPGGGAPEKPVGLFYIGVSGPGVETVREFKVKGDRGQIREQEIQRGLIELWKGLVQST